MCFVAIIFVNIMCLHTIISPERKENWQNLHKNAMHLDCPNSFAFSAEDICDHHLSDHNYYAICQVQFYFIIFLQYMCYLKNT